MEDTFTAYDQSQGTPSLMGANEGISSWNFGGVASFLGGLAQTGAGVYNTFAGDDTPNAVPSQSPLNQSPWQPTSSGSIGQYLPFIIGGAVLLLVVAFMSRR